MLVTGSCPDLRASEYRPYCVLQRALNTRRKSYLHKTKGVVLSLPSVSRQTEMQSKAMLSQRGCYAWSRKSPAEVLANKQLCDLEQVTPTSSLSFLISEVRLTPTPHHCYKYKISCHMLRSLNQMHDKCSRNAYICIRRFIHSFINEIKRLGSRKVFGPTLELTRYGF